MDVAKDDETSERLRFGQKPGAFSLFVRKVGQWPKRADSFSYKNFVGGQKLHNFAHGKNNRTIKR